MGVIGKIFGDSQAAIYLDECKGEKQGKDTNLAVYIARVFLRREKKKLIRATGLVARNPPRRWKNLPGNYWRFPGTSEASAAMDLHEHTSLLFTFRTIWAMLHRQKTLELWTHHASNLLHLIPAEPEPLGFGLLLLHVRKTLMQFNIPPPYRFFSDRVCWLKPGFLRRDGTIDPERLPWTNVNLQFETEETLPIHKDMLGIVDTDAYMYANMHHIQMVGEQAVTFHQKSIRQLPGLNEYRAGRRIALSRVPRTVGDWARRFNRMHANKRVIPLIPEVVKVR